MQNIPKKDFTTMADKQEERLEDEILLDQEDIIEEQDGEEELDLEEESEDLEEMELDTKHSSTDAANTLRPKSSNSEKMKTLVDAMSGMSGGDMEKFFDLAMGAAKEFPKKIPDGAAERNRGSVKMKGTPTPGKTVSKAIKEDLDTIFGDDAEELSEEIKDKMATLFEAAVSTQVGLEVAELEEAYENALVEELEGISEGLQDGLDQYLDYVADSWLEENEVAVQESLKTELAESFINDLGELCREYRMELPEGEDDVIETLVGKVDELTEALNDSEATNIELCEDVTTLRKTMIIENMANELSPVHYKKFKTLAENVEYDTDEENYAKKLEYIKEGFFGDTRSQTTPSSNIINEQIAEDAETEEPTKVFTDPAVKNIYDAISRTAKR